jgi:anti-sigma regulatory factor (Ser/Thr protein kinase)
MRVIDLRLPPRPDAVPLARRAVDDLAKIASASALEDVRLLVSELVTNSIRHGLLGPDEVILLVAEVHDGMLRIEVRDQGRGFMLTPRTSDSADDSGWGLFLVGRLADRWGMSSEDATTVWFEIALDRERDGARP